MHLINIGNKQKILLLASLSVKNCAAPCADKDHDLFKFKLLVVVVVVVVVVIVVVVVVVVVVVGGVVVVVVVLVVVVVVVVVVVMVHDKMNDVLMMT